MVNDLKLGWQVVGDKLFLFVQIINHDNLNLVLIVFVLFCIS
jgi:hypothetical protein